MATFHKYVMLNPICVVFPLVGTQSSIEDGTLRENILQLEAINCSASYLASIKLHLICLVSFYSICASENCSVWHYEDISHCHCQLQPHSRLLAVFKNTISCKNKAKVGQMNCWTKLTSVIAIDSLYNIQNKKSLLSQKKLPCSVAATLFSSCD